MSTSSSSGRGRLFVVSGPSGAGKGTVIREVIRRRPEIVLSVSATTRPARAGERHGVHYTFVSREEFLTLRDQGEFLESAEVYGHFYGTPRSQVERALAAGRDMIVEVDIQGAMAIKRAMPEAILVFVEPPSIDDLLVRLRGRATEDVESMRRRVEAAYEEIKVKRIYDHIVVNDEIGTAADALVRILVENHSSPTASRERPSDPEQKD
ncbi:MAG TPA: guanylate kinase [Actinomycetota bacterium]|nr:guanylate kinase [Actinomycetota bacterium]